MADPQIEHLLRRAGFGARPDELAMYGAMSIKQAVNALVDFDSVPDVVDSLISQPGYIGMTISGAFSPQSNINHARQRWLFRMVHTDRPLQEKMTLFWHNHFATGYNKIAGALRRDRRRALSRGEGVGGSRGRCAASSRCCATTRSAASRTSCSRSRRTPRCWSGSTAGPTPRRSRRRTSAARSWNCSRSASGITPSRTSTPPRASSPAGT